MQTKSLTYEVYILVEKGRKYLSFKKALGEMKKI